MKYINDDGGRAQYGYKGRAGDCVVRSIAITTRIPYPYIHQRISLELGAQRASSRTPKQAENADNGVFIRRKWFKEYMDELGFTWYPTMGIGTGCQVHLRVGELPMGRLVVSLSRHLTAVIDGVIHDTHNPSREGNRCVYGYWKKEY